MENQPTENAVPEQKPRNKNLPIIVAAIIAGALLIFAIIFVIIVNLNNKKPEIPEQPEEINEATSYVVLNAYDLDEDLEEFIDATNIITSYLELQDFYDEVSTYYVPLYLDCADELEETDCEGYADPSPTTEREPFHKPSGLDEEFFDSKDLIVTRFDSVWCGGSFNRIRNVSKNDDVVTIEIGYNGSCGPCAIETYVIFIEVEKDFATESDTFETEEIEENDPFCDPNISYKPIIYLYPEEETKISVKLGKPELLTTTYPQYNEETGWQVTAKPDGTLISGNREYYGLYWEGINQAEQKDEGFVIAGADTVEFLEEKLEILGLNEREANEFILYWLPKMEDNNYNYIRFATSAEIEKEMPLEVLPKPETTIRILMEFKPLDQKMEIKEQKLERAERKGYTVVEWGGTEIK